jgi:hypothetical protein
VKHSITRTTLATIAVAAAVVVPTATSCPAVALAFAGGAPTASAKPVSSAQTTVRPDDRAGVRSVDGLAVRLDGRIWGVIDARQAVANEPGIASGAPVVSTQPDPAYMRALKIRGEALNRTYAVDAIRARHDAMNRLFAETPYERAVRLRGEGLNAIYGTGQHSAVRPDDRGGIRSVDTVSATKSTSSGFDWGDAGIGAIGAAGVSLLVAGGMLLMLHLQHQRRDRIAAL